MLEKELAKRSLPDLFCVPGKKAVTTKDDWESIARPYWRRILLQEEYGKLPPVIEPEICVKANAVNFAGKAMWEEISFKFKRNGKEHTVPAQLIYPKGAKGCPFFVYLDFYSEIPSIYLPVEEIIDGGFGIFTVCHKDVTKDNGDFTDGLAGLFLEGERTFDDTGKIAYWAYMTSRMMDYLLTREEADKNAIGVAGHSRYGKTVLLAAALDERFSFVCSNESGCSGAALSRNRCKGAETIRDICGAVPYWFCPNYLKYIDNEDKQPFDQHCLLALVAPRRAYIGTAVDDIWGDTENQFLNCVASSKAWNLYGKAGFVSPDRMPVCGDVFTDGEIGFHLRAGEHFLSRLDWQIYMQSVRKFLDK